MAHEPEVPFRIIVEKPPPQVSYAVQLGKNELLPPQNRGDDFVFEFRLRVKRGTQGKPVFLGPAAQGPAHDRFVYVNSGTRAGQQKSPWSRRAKVKLATIDESLAARVLRQPGYCLEARIPGLGRDGGPSCGTTPPLTGGWHLVEW